jgi:predicted lipoprotein with Yx(FWY)xxD motif
MRHMQPSRRLAGRSRALGADPRRGSLVVIGLSVGGLLLAACGSSGYASPTTTSTSPQGLAATGTTLRTASVAKLGSVVVDARGHTVYVLSSGATKNLPCTASNGCTGVWPAVALPPGRVSAHAGAGTQAGLIGHVDAGGATYPTYGGWRLYEFSGDTGPSQSGGQGLSSYGGTWHVLSASGSPVTTTPTTTTTPYPGY